MRNYANFLELDAEELLELYRAATGTFSTSIPQVLNEPLLPRSSPRLWAGIFTGIMILLVCAVAGWYAYNSFYLGTEPWPMPELRALIGTPATSSTEAATPIVDATPTSGPTETSPTVGRSVTPPPHDFESCLSPVRGLAQPEPAAF